MKKPKNYYCHRDITQPGTNLGDKNLEIVQKIGQGSFGEVYKAFDPETSSLIVIKKFKNETIPSFSEQARILSELTNSTGFDRLKTSTTFLSTNEGDNQSRIMMGCLGPSTGSIMKKIKKMNIYSMKKIAYQVLQKLRQIHNRYYVHRDIKPDNILLGNKYDCHSIYLIDFGLTTTYKRHTLKARKVMTGIVGTAKYCPIASHLGLEQHPKDDLESLGYALLYYVSGELPWGNLEAESDEELFSKIQNKKKLSTVEDLCAGVNCLRKFWHKVQSYKVGDKIDYNELLEIFDVGDSKKENCFQFCQDCWVRSSAKQKMEDESEINPQPKSNKIRSLNFS